MQLRRALGPPPLRVCEIGSGTGWLTLKLLAAGYDVVIVDIRDIRERQRTGALPGSVPAPRGMIEFWVDPARPYHK